MPGAKNDRGKLDREEQAAEFLRLWLELRQIVQAANFNRFQGEGLSATQFSLLNVLNTERATTVKELAARMNLGSPTVVRSLDSLERRGLIRRERNPEDRREVRITATREGETLQNSTRGDFTRKIEEVFSAMSEKGRTALLEGYREFLAEARKRLHPNPERP